MTAEDARWQHQPLSSSAVQAIRDTAEFTKDKQGYSISTMIDCICDSGLRRYNLQSSIERVEIHRKETYGNSSGAFTKIRIAGGRKRTLREEDP